MRMTRNKKIIIAGLAGLAVVAIGVWMYALFYMKPAPAPEQTKSSQSESSEKPKEPTKPSGKYADLKGDAFDEAYLADMMAHNEGAVNMAEQAQAVTTHEEIRMLSADIISARSVEIFNMGEWQKSWRYEATMGQGHNSQTGEAKTVAGDMVEMQNQLKGLKAEAYDREFLKQMILHHQQGINMSKNAQTNAKHQEVKDLAQLVTDDYTAEISQMKQWQKLWGYR